LDFNIHSVNISPIFDHVMRQRRARRVTVLGVCVSLFAHLMMFMLIRYTMQEEGTTPVPLQSSPLVVHFSQPDPPLTQPALPEPQVVTAQSEPRPKKRPIVRRNPVVASARPVVKAPPIAIEPPVSVALPPQDMMAMLDAARARRNMASADDQRDSTENKAASGNDIAIANINHSLQNLQKARGDGGTSGVFQIIQKGVRTAQFSFKGWNSDSSRKWNQLIEVDAGVQGDVERAIVRKMIELIRTHFQGDFNWDSRRLGRVIVLSARRSDNTELENFLMQEFFSNLG
jgi:hypothetical protein